jgi:hypothetical protein
MQLLHFLKNVYTSINKSDWSRLDQAKKFNRPEDGHTTKTCSGYYWIKYSRQCCVRRKPWTWSQFQLTLKFISRVMAHGFGITAADSFHKTFCAWRDQMKWAVLLVTIYLSFLLFIRSLKQRTLKDSSKLLPSFVLYVSCNCTFACLWLPAKQCEVFSTHSMSTQASLWTSSWRHAAVSMENVWLYVRAWLLLHFQTCECDNGNLMCTSVITYVTHWSTAQINLDIIKKMKLCACICLISESLNILAVTMYGCLAWSQM